MAGLSHDFGVSRRCALRLGSAGLAGALVIRSDGVAHAATSEANKALVQHFLDKAINAGQFDIIDEVFDADFVDHTAGSDHVPGPARIKQRFRALRAAVPGLEVHLEAIVAESDLVAARARWSGPHPPAGMHLLGTTLHLFRIGDGLILEAWGTGWESVGQQSRMFADA